MERAKKIKALIAEETAERFEVKRRVM